MSTNVDLNLSFSEINRTLRQPLTDSTLAYRGSAMGVSSGRIRPLQAGDVFAGFLTARADNRTFSAGADPMLVQVIASGAVELTVGEVLATSIGETVYATDENTFSLAAVGSKVGKVLAFVSAGVALVGFDALVQSESGGVATDGIWDAAGDIAIGIAANTAQALPIGTAKQVLVVNAGATAPEWGDSTKITSPDPGDYFSTDNVGGQLQEIAADVAALSAGGSDAVATDVIWNAAGDLAVGTGANTAGILSIGASGEVLTSNGTTATWAVPTTIATDTIWDAAGDLVVGSGSNTAARLAKGTANQVLSMNGDASAVVWADPSSAATNAGIATSSGSDLTAMSAPSGVVEGYTAGAEYEVTRDVDDIPTSLDVVGTTISSALTRVGTTDYYIVDDGDPFYVGGAKCVTLAQMREWETAALAASTTIKPGYRIWVTDVGAWTSPANVTTTLGAMAVWTAIGWMWETGVLYRTDYPSSDWTNSASVSGALSPLTIPAGVMGKLDTATQSLYMTFSSGANTRTIACTLNSSTYLSVSGVAASVEYVHYQKSLRNKGSTTSQDSAGSGVVDTSASSSSAQLTFSINTQTTALLFEPKITYGGTSVSDVGRVVRHSIFVTSDLPVA